VPFIKYNAVAATIARAPAAAPNMALGRLQLDASMSQSVLGASTSLSIPHQFQPHSFTGGHYRPLHVIRMRH
jgi:hypothetical protein